MCHHRRRVLPVTGEGMNRTVAGGHIPEWQPNVTMSRAGGTARDAR